VKAGQPAWKGWDSATDDLEVPASEAEQVYDVRLVPSGDRRLLAVRLVHRKDPDDDPEGLRGGTIRAVKGRDFDEEFGPSSTTGDIYAWAPPGSVCVRFPELTAADQTVYDPVYPEVTFSVPGPSHKKVSVAELVYQRAHRHVTPPVIPAEGAEISIAPKVKTPSGSFVPFTGASVAPGLVPRGFRARLAGGDASPAGEACQLRQPALRRVRWDGDPAGNVQRLVHQGRREADRESLPARRGGRHRFGFVHARHADPRVDRALQVLIATDLAGSVRRDAPPVINSQPVIRDPETGTPISFEKLPKDLASIRVDISGANFRPNASAVLIAETREDLPELHTWSSPKVTPPSLITTTFRNPKTVPDIAGVTWRVVVTNEDGTQSNQFPI
jgi:hypothetical protein